MTSNITETPELQQRRDLGKKGKLWSIEVIYKRGNETKRMQKSNNTGAEVMEFRELVFRAGLAVPIDPGRFFICAPWDILDIEVTRQSKYFNDWNDK